MKTKKTKKQTKKEVKKEMKKYPWTDKLSQHFGLEKDNEILRETVKANEELFPFKQSDVPDPSPFTHYDWDEKELDPYDEKKKDIETEDNVCPTCDSESGCCGERKGWDCCKDNLDKEPDYSLEDFRIPLAQNEASYNMDDEEIHFHQSTNAITIGDVEALMDFIKNLRRTKMLFLDDEK